MTDTFAGETAGRFEHIQLDLLAPDPTQVRRFFSEEALDSLAGSIKAQGILQPIVVRPGKDGKMEIVAGERRYRAAQRAGRTNAPVIVRDDLVGKDLTIIQVVENLQREGLTLAETCLGVSRLVDSVGLQDAAKQLGKSEAWVSKHASVIGLPDPIKKLVHEGKIDSVDVAKEMATLMDLNPKEATRLIQRLDPTYQRKPDEIKALQKEEIEDKKYIEKIKDPEEREYEQLAKQREEEQKVTRAEVRLQVLDAKEEIRRKEEQKGQKADPKRAKELASQKKKQAERKVREEQANRLNNESSALGHELTRKLHSLVGLVEPTRSQYNWNGHLAIEVTPSQHFSGYNDSVMPAGATGVKFDVSTVGAVERIEAFAKILDPKPALLGVALKDRQGVTLEEARAIAKILGPARVQFSLSVERIGGALVKTLEQAKAPSPAATAKPKAKTSPAPAKKKPAPAKKKAGAKK